MAGSWFGRVEVVVESRSAVVVGVEVGIDFDFAGRTGSWLFD